MKKTIGFSNKNNMWTSKYDYVSSNYSSIDKKFFSSNTQTSGGDLTWRHDAGGKNRFYGAKYPSTVAVSFAGDPSQNKLFKSMSIEGQGEFKNTINLFTTSEFIGTNGRREYVNAGTVRDYGGNKYAHLGQDPRIRATADLKYMGHIYSTERGFTILNSSLGNNLYILPVTAAVGVGQREGNRTKIGFKISTSPTVGFIRGGSLDPLGNASKYIEISSEVTIATSEELQSVGLLSAYNTEGLVIKCSLNAVAVIDSIIQEAGLGGRGEGVSIFGLIDPKNSGDMMRGQYAEAHFTIGDDDFEIYSLNLNYEPTDLDHSK